MAWNSTHFILGQLFGRNTLRVASLCSPISGPQLGRPEWPGWLSHLGLRLERPLPRWLPHSHVEHLCEQNGKVGSAECLCVASGYMWPCQCDGLRSLNDPQSKSPKRTRKKLHGLFWPSLRCHSESFLWHFFSYKWIRGQPRFTKRGMRPHFLMRV